MRKIKKIFGVAVLCAMCVTSMGTTIAFAKGFENDVKSQKMIGEQKKLFDQETSKIPEKIKDLQNKISKQMSAKGGLHDSKSLQNDLIRDANNIQVNTTYYGTYPTRSGIILVSGDNFTWGMQHGHAGIVYDSNYTVESFPTGDPNTDGVRLYPNNWATRYNTVYAVTLNDTTTSQDSDAALYCENQYGDPFNWNFFYTSTRSSFYCAQLPWAAFYDGVSIDLNYDGGIIWPADLANSPEVYFTYAKY